MARLRDTIEVGGQLTPEIYSRALGCPRALWIAMFFSSSVYYYDILYWITVSIIKLRKEKYVASTVRPNLWADKHIIHIGKSIWMCIAEENVSVVPFILIASNQSVYNYSSSCKVDFTQIHGRQARRQRIDDYLVLPTYDLWISGIPGRSASISRASCVSVQHPQQRDMRQSLTNDPSIPCFSRIDALICAAKYKFASGTSETSPHFKQSSPFFSAVFPNT